MSLDLTIVIPTLNCASTLPPTLESVRPLQAQGAAVVVVDSYSSDGSLECARRSANEVLLVPKGNLYAAVNAGVEATRTEWVTYLNGDDMLYADSVGSMIEQVRPTDDVLYGNLDFIDKVGRYLHHWRSAQPREYLPLAARPVMPVPQPGTLFRRSVFDRLGGFDLTFKYSADFDFFLRAYLAGFHFVKCGNYITSAFRIHSAQTSQKRNQEMRDESMLSVRNSRLAVARWRRSVAFGKMRLRNWDGYVMRILRWRQLTGEWRLPRSIELMKICE